MTITTTTHLNFRGDARRALEFYRSVFGGELTTARYADLGMPADAPGADGVVFGLLESPSGFRVMAYDIPGATGGTRSAAGAGSTRRESGLTITDRPFFLSVRGDVFNPSDYPLKVPPLMLIAQDESGAPLGAAFMFRTQESTVAPGETITFRIPFENPPKGMKGFSVTFGRVNAAK